MSCIGYNDTLRYEKNPAWPGFKPFLARTLTSMGAACLARRDGADPGGPNAPAPLLGVISADGPLPLDAPMFNTPFNRSHTDIDNSDPMSNTPYPSAWAMLLPSTSFEVYRMISVQHPQPHFGHSRNHTVNVAGPLWGKHPS